MAWALLPAEMIRDRRLALPDGGRGIFSPVYIDNLVEGVVLAAASGDAVGQVFTLSDGVGIPNREFFAPYAELVGRRLVTVPTPVAMAAATVVERAARRRPGDNDVNPVALRYMLRRGTYSNAKARRVLGWGGGEGATREIARLAGRIAAREKAAAESPRSAKTPVKEGRGDANFSSHGGRAG